MSKRGTQPADDGLDQSEQLAIYETGRSAAEAGDAKGPPKKEDEHLSVFWRVFGGTILSIAALVAVTLYNNMSSSITELRAEVGREREARAELVKKDEFNARITSQYERLRAAEGMKVELEGMKEKVNGNAAAVEAAKKDAAAFADAMKKDSTAGADAVKKDVAAIADAMKKDIAALELIKERVALLETIKKDVAGLDTLKEKVAGAATDVKALQADVQKLTAEVDRNKVYDLERKAFRDGQHKQVEEALKELLKGLQDCREKLARLEGAKPAAGDAPAVYARPANPSKAKPTDDGPGKAGEVKPAGGTAEPGTAKPAGGM